MVFKLLVAFISCGDCSISRDVGWLNVALNLIYALVGVVLMTAALMNRNKAWVYTLSHVVARLCMSVVSIEGSIAVFHGRPDVSHIQLTQGLLVCSRVSMPSTQNPSAALWGSAGTITSRTPQFLPAQDNPL